MQKKHNFLGGGASSRLGQNPKFCTKFFWTAPLTALVMLIIGLFLGLVYDDGDADDDAGYKIPQK